VSYLSSRNSIHTQNLSIPELGNGRHIIGWCTDVKCSTGTRAHLIRKLKNIY
jgi:hypothetical protein